MTPIWAQKTVAPLEDVEWQDIGLGGAVPEDMPTKPGLRDKKAGTHAQYGCP